MNLLSTPLLVGSLTLFGLELALWLLRRFFGVRPGFLHHMWALAVAFYLGWARSLGLSDKLGALVLVLSAWVAFAVLDAAVLGRPRASDGRPLLPTLARDVAQLLFLAGVGLVALSLAFSVPLETVLVSSTVLSVVLGLALQDVLKNLFAGIAMQMEGAPRLGDWLELDGQAARIEEMRWRTTRLRTTQGVDILEPNSSIAQARLIDYGSGTPARAFDHPIRLAYETPPAEARKALLAAARSCEPVLDRPEPQVLLAEFADSWIVYKLRAWTRAVDRPEWFRDQVNSRIWYEIHRAGLRVPFPIRTLQMRASAREAAAEREQQVTRFAGRLAGVSIFAELDGESLRHLAERAQRQYFDSGERLVTEGAAGDSMMVLLRGRAEVSRALQDPSGDRVRVAELGEDDYFGERVLLTGETRSATVTAISDCEVLVLGRGDLLPVLEGQPHLAEVLSRALAQRIAESEAAVEERRAERSRRPTRRTEDTHESLLERIRHLFRLPGS
ncbi:MAG TPA: mechanosensitive ion channel family protein [Thermoanaerobaculia bacterium]|nr:mechanosensitive ion channel family protein [Thermoanaerobaculia bacterium]